MRTKDCVCRAISTAVNLPYRTVEKLLEISSEHYKCDTLNVDCYSNLLEDVFELPRFDCDFTKTVKDVANAYPKNRVIVRIKEHLTSAIYGCVLDIWDCSGELVDCYWII